MSDLSTYLSEQRRWIDYELDRHMPAETDRPTLLHQAMRYAVFSGGKRLRPILCIAAATGLKADRAQALLPAIAIEVLHTYTLVHDDLPAMDDDALRRGQPTTHIRFGEGQAILVGDALLTLAFEWLAACVAPPPFAPGQLIVELAEASGSRGIIGGQSEDLTAVDQPGHEVDLDYIHLHKTATLFRAALRMGGIVAAANAEELDALSTYGCNLGLAFQITDDLLDETGTTEIIGKPAGSDRRNEKVTYITRHGFDAARRRAAQLIDEAVLALNTLRGDTTPLTDIARAMLNRTS